MDREESPPNYDDSPIGPQDAMQSLSLLQVPERGRSRNISISSSMTDLDAPIYSRTTTYSRGGRQGFNGRLAFAIAASALGSSFQHGYNTGVVNAPQKLIEEWIKNVLANRSNIDASEVEQTKVTMIWSVAVAIFCVGGMIGGVFTGTIAERFGRKNGLLLNNILVLLTAIFEGAAKAAGSFEMIIIGRFLIGINSGLNAGLAPMYLAEISPVHLRGAVGTVYQLVITISILLSQILGLETVLGTEDGWPALLALTIVPGIFQVVTLPMCPESPKFLLLSRGLEIEAQRSLTWLRGTIEVHDEMDEMRSEYEAAKLVPKVTVKDMFMNATLRIPLFISIGVMICQQLSGINAVMFFSTKIFKMANLSDTNAQYATLGMGAINVFMTLVSLVLVERAGRKTLLLIGLAGMCVTTIILTISLTYVNSAAWVSYFSIFLVILFVVMFATGPGSIPWFLVSELFNQGARPVATSLAVGVNWTANFIVGIAFLPLQEAMGANVFIIFSILLALFVLFVYKKVPETKNKTMDEISSMFRQISYQ